MVARLLKKDEIFNAAAEIACAAERAAYLHQACGDDLALKAQIEELLDHDRSADSFWDRTVPGLPAVAGDAIAERPGTVIGRYKLLEEIGEGGFGVVFMAEQEEPVRRRVALKIIKAGMDTRQVVARFEAERQALAMMDHPNIARVFDAGATETGRPYFVMELVKGIPITEYCDEHKLTTDERLNLFLDVCSAVQHAHQKGIIHRDLKPSNVMVTLHDDKPVPKIIDFGIAKATQARLTDKTLFTEFRQLIGTPAYMSPEQAQMIGLDVDTRSDIYSLGVLLYELLTGSTPFDSKQLMQSGYDEMRRIIREVEPPRPSTRLSSSGSLPFAGRVTEGVNDSATIAANRHTEPGKLTRELRGELDWIVMKCLEKDRTRRYESAGSLARDIERHLHDEPVQACPPSAAYHFRKFARRNKVALAIASAAIAMLLLGVAGLALSNRLIAAQRLRAEQNFVRARTAVSNTLADAAYGIGDWSQLSPALRKKFAEEAIRFYESFLQEESTDPALQFETAVAFRSLSQLYRSIDEMQQSEQFIHRSIARLEGLTSKFSDVAKYRQQLGYSHYALGLLLKKTKRPLEAEVAHKKAIDLYEDLIARGPDESDYYIELAPIYPVLATLQNSRGAEQEAERTIQRLLGFLSNAPVESFDAAVMARTLLINSPTGAQKQEAHQQFRRAIEEYGQVAVDYPNDLDRRVKALTGYVQTIGQCAAVKGFEGEVDELNRRLEAELPKLVADFPDSNDCQWQTANLYRDWAVQLLPYGNYLSQAERALCESIKFNEKLSQSDPKRPGVWLYLADSTIVLGDLYWRTARPKDAETAYLRAIEIFDQRESEIDANESPTAMVTDLVWLAYYLGCTHREEQAAEFVRKAARNSQLVMDPSASADALYYTAVVQARLGDTAGYRATCTTLIELPFDTLEGLTKSRPIWTPCLAPDALEDPTLPIKLGEQVVTNNSLGERHFALYILGAAHYRAGQYEQAAERLQESIAAFPSRREPVTDSMNYHRLFLAMTQWQLGQKDKARRILAETLPGVDAELASPSSGWNRRATLELLRAEAEALIEREEADYSVENKSRTGDEAK
jgi:serine/threonine protein kinase